MVPLASALTQYSPVSLYLFQADFPALEEELTFQLQALGKLRPTFSDKFDLPGRVAELLIGFTEQWLNTSSYRPISGHPEQPCLCCGLGLGSKRACL